MILDKPSGPFEAALVTKLQFRRSSAVEQLTVNQLVVGSIPTAGAIFPQESNNLALTALSGLGGFWRGVTSRVTDRR